MPARSRGSHALVGGPADRHRGRARARLAGPRGRLRRARARRRLLAGHRVGKAQQLRRRRGRHRRGPQRPPRRDPRPATASAWRSIDGTTTASRTGCTRRTRCRTCSATPRGSTGPRASRRAWNAQLSGVVSADPLRELTRKFRADPSDPQDLQTTLVLRLQEAALAALGRNRGAVVLLDPRTGEVLALVSNPTFDASGIANPATATQTFDRLRADDRPAAPPARHAGPLCPGFGVQDRDRGGRPGQRRRLAARRPSTTSRPRRTGAGSSTASGSVTATTT